MIADGSGGGDQTVVGLKGSVKRAEVGGARDAKISGCGVCFGGVIRRKILQSSGTSEQKIGNGR